MSNETFSLSTQGDDRVHHIPWYIPVAKQMITNTSTNEVKQAVPSQPNLGSVNGRGDWDKDWRHVPLWFFP